MNIFDGGWSDGVRIAFVGDGWIRAGNADSSPRIRPRLRSSRGSLVRASSSFNSASGATFTNNQVAASFGSGARRGLPLGGTRDHADTTERYRYRLMPIRWMNQITHHRLTVPPRPPAPQRSGLTIGRHVFCIQFDGDGRETWKFFTAPSWGGA